MATDTRTLDEMRDISGTTAHERCSFCGFYLEPNGDWPETSRYAVLDGDDDASRGDFYVIGVTNPAGCEHYAEEGPAGCAGWWASLSDLSISLAPEFSVGERINGQ